MTAPDWRFTVDLTGDRSLTEKGWDVLADAIDAASLVGVIEQAVIFELRRALPRDADWYTLHVTETPVIPGREAGAP